MTSRKCLATWILLTNSEIIVENEELQRSHSPWSASDGKIQWTDNHFVLWQILSL